MSLTRDRQRRVMASLRPSSLNKWLSVKVCVMETDGTTANVRP
jgi:hypothetical protein